MRIILAPMEGLVDAPIRETLTKVRPGTLQQRVDGSGHARGRSTAGLQR